MLPAVKVTPELAPKLREIVCSPEGGLLPFDHCTDEQLILFAKAVQQQWTNQRIAHYLYTYHTKSQGLAWRTLQELIPELKRRISELLSSDTVPETSPEGFDAIAENTALIRDLRSEYDVWTEKIRDHESPTKSMFEHVARLARLLKDAIANHATIQAKLNSGNNQGGAGNQGAPNAPGFSPIHSQFSAENMQVVFTGLSGDGMSDFLETARLKMEAEARPHAVLNAEAKKIKGELLIAEKQTSQRFSKARREKAARGKDAQRTNKNEVETKGSNSAPAKIPKADT